MPTVKSDVSEAEALARYMKIALERVAVRAIHALALGMVQHVVAVVIPREPRQPVDRGAYRAAWKVKKARDGAWVFNGMPYAGVVEFGARPENVKISREMIVA